MDLGGKIKDLRLMLGLTQEELADRCELTKGYISQLESDNSSPSISTLEDILAALGTTLSEFFKEDNRQVVFKETDFSVKEEDGARISWLIPGSQTNEMEPIELELAPHASTDPHPPHEAEEFGYVMMGSVVLHLGEKKFTVKKGEAFYFVSDKAHYLENKQDSHAKILWVTSPPSF